MSLPLKTLFRLSALSIFLLCSRCAGNMVNDNGSDSSMGGARGSGTGHSGSGPASDANMAGSQNPNGTAMPKAGACASMLGPCSTTLTAIPLTGCSSADYKAQVTIGGNQTLSMLVDTGSTTIAVVDSDCADCQGVTPTYTMGQSAQNAGTAVQSQYGTGNGWSGTAVSDMVQITPAIKPLRMRFARVTKQTSTSSGVSFFSGSDCTGNVTENAQQGIFGIGNASDAVAGTDTYLDILKASGQVNDAFAFEACDNGGRMWLGGYDPNSVSAAPVFTPLDTSKGYDVVTLSSLGIGSNNAVLSTKDFGQTLVDTGTSIFLLPQAAFDTLSSSIEADANFLSLLPKGFLSSSQFVSIAAPASTIDAQLPAMHLTFPGVGGGADVTVDLPASESYLTPFSYNGQAGYLSGISPVQSNPVTTILGNSTMHSHVLIFDRGNKQLGYAPHTTCR